MTDFDELKQDKANARRIAQDFLDGKVDRARFIDRCMEIFGPYDSLCRPTFYAQIESAMGEHFCEFWDECVGGNHAPSGWQDFTPLFILRRSS